MKAYLAEINLLVVDGECRGGSEEGGDDSDLHGDSCLFRHGIWFNLSCKIAGFSNVYHTDVFSC
jgi:hypothetical protein